MVIPSQPPLTATKKSTLKPQTNPPAATTTDPCPQYQLTPLPVPASYTTASTPSQPTFNLQARTTQPGPQQQSISGPAQVQYMPAQPRGPDFAYGPPQPGFCPAPSGVYQDQHYGGAPSYGGQNTWRTDPSHHVVPLVDQTFQTTPLKKTYITDPPASLAPFGGGPSAPVKVS